VQVIWLKVWGDYALFSRPEFKVERVSYPVMTPSAARGILEAIFWKPEFRYQICEIGVLKQGSQTTLLRNELTTQQGDEPFSIDETDKEGKLKYRAQRASLILKDVAYLIAAKLVLQPHANEAAAKYLSQFERRADRGAYHHAPYLGTREFAASFERVEKDELPTPQPIDLSIGQMLFDVAFVEDERRQEMEFMRHSRSREKPVKGYAQALFFSAEIRNGVLVVPQAKYRELDRIAGSHA
jgi:CRISPR-associated protein Cas5d